jgi:lipoprotein-releasing system ATP-binding protein
MSHIALEAKAIRKIYPSLEKELLVLDGVDFSVKPGEFIAIMGESGSGKSTLLNILGGLDHPTSGDVYIGGQKITGLNESELGPIRNQKMGYIFQSHHLLVEFTALENVMIPYRIYHRDEKVGQKRAEELLEKTGILARAHHRAGELSGGEMQRVAIARALILSPEIILADEPTGNLDPNNSERMVLLLKSLCEERKTAVVFVTHSESLSRHCHRRFRLIDKKIQEV